MSELQEPTTSYDQVEYSSYPFQQSHPDRLATIATLFGMHPPRLDDCRVLELGCSSGGNLIPMADQLPQARFVGIDASTKAIEKGNQTIRAVGLQNIELRHADILKLDDALGEFDYIITHGVFSWVPQPVQDKILDLCAKQLAPNGVAYVSYNTYPGWHFRGMIRDVMSYHAQFFETPQRQLNEARALVDFLAKSVPTENNPYGMLLSRELELLRDKQGYYLFHEFQATERIASQTSGINPFRSAICSDICCNRWTVNTTERCLSNA
ncbi:MAG: class I SAM-dependent methyltransferase [Planctomycetia bacterium]|nr:class I SAM-dependent methyltransferase [Planctomycetia bacterium]